MSNKALRNTLRIVHIVGAIMLGIYLYSPLADNALFAAAVQFVAFPLILGVTGLALWQQAKLNKWLRSRGNSS